MSKAANTQPPQIAHISITLDGVTPKVSRIVAVPVGIHLDMLHLVIQAAMGWSNTHLWLLRARGCTWGVPDPDFGYGDGPSDAGRTTLLDMIEYVHDFGDHWSHMIKIVNNAWRARRRLPVADRRGRPLSDRGQWRPSRVHGFARGAARPGPSTPHEALDWPGPDFDPTAVDRTKLEQDVADLAKLMTPRRRTSAKAGPGTKSRKTSDDEHF